MQDEDSLSFVSAVIGALGSTLTTTPSASSVAAAAASPTLLVGVFVAAFAKTLPSLKEKPRKWEDWILLIFTFCGALAAAWEAQTNVYSSYPYVPAIFLLIGILGKTLLPLTEEKGAWKKRWDGWKVEDKLTAILAIIVLVSLGFIPQYATIGVFATFLTKTLTSTNSSTNK
jgi:uncharacterized membrane protein YfcA